MKKPQTYLSAVLAVCLLVLCGCTRQRNIDTAEFCKRVNGLRAEETLTLAQFFKEPAENTNEYNCNFLYTEGQTALLSLKTDTEGTVIGFQLTCIPEGATPSDETLRALYQTYVQLVTVLTVRENTGAGEELLSAAGILPENLHFTDYGYVSENEKHQFAVFSGESYLSLFCERV